TLSKALITLVAIALVVGSPFVYGIYKAIEWRWWISGIRFGDVSFESDLSRGRLIGLYWKIIGWFWLLLIVFTIWIGVVLGGAYWFTDFNGNPEQKILLVSQQWPFLVGMGLGYVGFALMSGMLTRIYLIHDVWQRVAESVTVHNLSATQNVA